ncbi:MAG TPA: site-specific integrase [Roseiarcus sp.]|nr:site-specific integrase [Roseiarcus sp.]
MIDRKTIGLREVRGLQPGQVIWDSKVPAFGARRQKGAAVAYVLFYRTKDGRQRWHTIGRHGAPWTPDEARKEARRILGEVADGNDPAGAKTAARKAATVSDLCDLYWRDAEAGRLLTRRRAPKKASTLATDKGRIERHVKPLLGALKVASASRDDVERFLHAVAEGETAGRIKSAKKHGLANVRGGKGTASRTVGLLGAIFAYAVRHRMRADNPVHGVTRFADGKRERRLSDDEYAALGEALRLGQESIWPSAIGAARFLAFTGWRSGEALGLRWAEIDLARRTATLADTKTGKSVRPLSRAACDLLQELPRLGDLVFPASRGEGRMAGFPKFWARVAKLGAMPADITPHVLRHSFASLASDVGYSEATIAALVGHQGRSMTSRYIHSADAVLLAAADVVSDRILSLMGEPCQSLTG